jgi:hypothetical protein
LSIRFGQVFLRRFNLSRTGRRADKLTLFCLVDKESTSRAFEVEISATRTVSYLKKLIKKEQAPAFDDITANQLTLWRVDIPKDRKGSAITVDALDDVKTELDEPRTYLSNLFPNGPGEDTYIIVQRPPAGNAVMLGSHCKACPMQMSSFNAQ